MYGTITISVPIAPAETKPMSFCNRENNSLSTSNEERASRQSPHKSMAMELAILVLGGKSTSSTPQYEALTLANAIHILQPELPAPSM